MRKQGLKPKILKKLKEKTKGKISEPAIRVALTRVRKKSLKNKELVKEWS